MPAFWLCTLLLVGAPLPLSPQSLELKRAEFSLEAPGTCSDVTVATSGLVRPAAAIDSLLSAGSRAAILGEHEAAVDLLREAATLDPRNPVVSYRLARTLDDSGDGRAAIVEYCRYIVLAPEAPDGQEIRDRIRDLELDGFGAPPAPWRAAGAEGIAAYDGGRFDDAVEAFSRAIGLAPDIPDTHYNRAAAHLGLSHRDAAIRDLEAYLSRAPAPDPEAVLALERLRTASPAATPLASPPSPGPAAAPAPGPGESPDARTTAAPGSAFVQGLVLPGLGQHATGRTALGIVVLSATGGAVYYGSRSRVVTRLQGAYDPFGNFYEYEVAHLDRPNRTVGFAAAAGIALAGALESYLFASRHRGTAATGFHPAVARSPIALHLSHALGSPTLTVSVPLGGSKPPEPTAPGR